VRSSLNTAPKTLGRVRWEVREQSGERAHWRCGGGQRATRRRRGQCQRAAVNGLSFPHRRWRSFRRRRCRPNRVWPPGRALRPPPEAALPRAQAPARRRRRRRGGGHSPKRTAGAALSTSWPTHCAAAAAAAAAGCEQPSWRHPVPSAVCGAGLPHHPPKQTSQKLAHPSSSPQSGGSIKRSGERQAWRPGAAQRERTRRSAPRRQAPLPPFASAPEGGWGAGARSRACFVSFKSSGLVHGRGAASAVTAWSIGDATGRAGRVGRALAFRVHAAVAAPQRSAIE